MTTPKTPRNAAPGKRPARRQPAAKSARKPRRTATMTVAQTAARPGTKQAALLALLQRPKGATISQMCTKTGWQAHSIRAALTGLRKRGLELTRSKDEAGATIYRAGPA